MIVPILSTLFIGSYAFAASSGKDKVEKSESSEVLGVEKTRDKKANAQKLKEALSKVKTAVKDVAQKSSHTHAKKLDFKEAAKEIGKLMYGSDKIVRLYSKAIFKYIESEKARTESNAKFQERIREFQKKAKDDLLKNFEGKVSEDDDIKVEFAKTWRQVMNQLHTTRVETEATVEEDNNEFFVIF
jgi:uncharacterized protein YabN with tetrapyrrole methylase and pyrophosphatase domain